MEMKQQGIAKAKRGCKERPTVAERLGIHKFRVTYCLRVDGKENETTFLYHDLRAARRNYKSILLELYRKRDLDGFCICLNRFRDRKWRHPIHREAVGLGV